MTSQPKILFSAPYGQWGIHNQVDAILAKALELRGCQALAVLCDGLYADCTILRDVPTQAENHVCQSCAKASQQLFSAFQIPQVQLRQFIQSDDREQAKQWVETVAPDDYANARYQNLPIGEWVTSSIYTYFRITAKGLQRSDVREVHRRYLIDGVVTYKALSRILDWFQPDRIVHFNGRMAPYRVAFELGRSRGLEVLTHERGSIDDSFSFRQNATCSETKPLIHYTQAWKHVPLRKSEIEQVRSYFHQREAGKNTNWNPFYTYQTDYSKVRHQLRIPSEAKIFSIFTTSEDELALSKDYQGLSNQIEVLKRIIEIFSDRDEYLVIRHHPHIGGLGGSKPETDFLVRAYQQSLTIPSNVRIVMPSEQLTSYALLANTDAAMVFFSTVSIEAVARGIPTVVFENSTYRQALSHVLHQDKLDKENLRLVIDRLLSPSAQLQVEDFQKLYRFTHTYFFRFSQKFKSFGVKNRHYLDIRITSFEDLKPGIDQTLDRICNHILDGTSLYEMPPTEINSLSLTDEENFLKEEIERVREQRNAVKIGSFLSQEIPVGLIHVKESRNKKTEQDLPKWQTCSRHRSLVSQVFLTANKHINNGFQSLIYLLNKTQEDYILIAHEGIQYNESFISYAIDRLTEDCEKDWDGVWSAGWIQSPNNTINQKLFTHSSTHDNYHQAIQILPELIDPFVLLSFVLMKRTVIVKLLQTVQSVNNNLQASEMLFYGLNQLKIDKTELPLLVVHQAQLQNQQSTVQTLLDLSRYYEQIKKQPTSSQLYRQLGDILNEQGKLDAARKAYQYAERLRTK
ncbi:hypothetical protein [Baaleninema simplex]|uniref:hypothetical protein n=1 Tax=Baaleninema simplex TaxID=2862350 RepID=UPI0003448C77|nr:hypothetical protein [Baaleninema simplex]